MSMSMTPEADEAANRPTAPAELFHLLGGNFPGSSFVRPFFGPFDQPFDENAGLRITEPARKGVILQDVAQDWFGQHYHLSPFWTHGRARASRRYRYSKTG